MQSKAIALVLALSALGEATPADPTTTTPSACYTYLPSPTPSTFICGVAGKLKTPTRIARFTSGGDPDTCRSNCLADKSCISFSYNSQTGYCQTFSKALIRMGWTVDAKSPKVFYNRNCFAYSPKGCNKTPTPSPTPTAVPLQPQGYWLQAQTPAYYLNDWYLGLVLTDIATGEGASMMPEGREAVQGAIYDLNNEGILSLNAYSSGGQYIPFWEQTPSCDAVSEAYFFTVAVNSADITPTCVSTLTADGIRGDLTCSTSACGELTWSYYNDRVKLGPVNSPNSWQGISISYAYPQIAYQYEVFLLQIKSPDQTLNGLFIAQDNTGTLVLVNDYANAFDFTLQSGFPHSPDSTTYLGGTFADPVGMVKFSTAPRGDASPGTPTVFCNPVGTPPVMECRVGALRASPPVYSGFYQYETQFSFCVDDATYGTGLALGPDYESGCSPVSLAVVQAPASSATTA